MTKITRTNITNRSTRTKTVHQSENTKLKTDNLLESQKQTEPLAEQYDFTKLKILYQSNPEQAVQMLNQQILKSHPLGKMLSETSCKKIVQIITKILAEDKESSEYLDKLLGG
ncbi:hypothetical protein [Vibrio cincinnatiensis]|uniref:hypothetical protein n=1 Tax=Vibrio cincinnatiensis TaxID=675 RepID=UPI001EDFE250|nr:hypothetical protein [Vibrio cincinnatiensis]MCG3723711.1 hypothetical protein [Vibrio cincinnatiensis]